LAVDVNFTADCRGTGLQSLEARFIW